MKSRKFNRDLKEKYIQEENDQLVERLISQRRNPSPLYEEPSFQLVKSRKRDQASKRSNSLMLPKIANPVMPELR